MSDWVAAKASGNESYRLGRYEDAVSSWSLALKLVPNVLSSPESESESSPNRLQIPPSDTGTDKPVSETPNTESTSRETAEFARAVLSGNVAEIERLRSKQNVVPGDPDRLPPQPSAADSARAVLWSNMAQAKAQLRDPEGAAHDCSQALSLLLQQHPPAGTRVGSESTSSTRTTTKSLVPESVLPEDSASCGLVLKALVRRALAYEELGKLKLALGDLDFVLGRSHPSQQQQQQQPGQQQQQHHLLLPASLSKVARACRGRCEAALSKDRELLAKCKSADTLVNSDQTLRLHLHGAAPSAVLSGHTSFDVLCNIANEFGLWRPRDFPSVVPPPPPPPPTDSSAEAAPSTPVAEKRGGGGGSGGGRGGGGGGGGGGIATSPTTTAAKAPPPPLLLLPLRVTLRAHNAAARRCLPALSVSQAFDHHLLHASARLPSACGVTLKSGTSSSDRLRDLVAASAPSAASGGGGGAADDAGVGSGSGGSGVEKANGGGSGSVSGGSGGGGAIVWMGEDGRAAMRVCISTTEGGGGGASSGGSGDGGASSGDSGDGGASSGGSGGDGASSGCSGDGGADPKSGEGKAGQDFQREGEPDAASVPTVFLEISPALTPGSAPPARPVMQVLSLPIAVLPAAPPAPPLAPATPPPLPTEQDLGRREASGGGGSSADLAGRVAIGAHIGAHSCRLTHLPAAATKKKTKKDPSSSDGGEEEGAGEEEEEAAIEVVVAESPGQLGIGGKVWDAALVLLHYLRARRSSLVHNRRILELGAGTGLVGIACGKCLGARDVVITDLPEVCELIQVNIDLNADGGGGGGSGGGSSGGGGGSGGSSSSLSEIRRVDQADSAAAAAAAMAAVPLAWSDPPPNPLPSRVLLAPPPPPPPPPPHGGGAAAAGGAGSVSDGGDDGGGSGFEGTIVLADVVYDPELYVPLVATLAALVPPPLPPPPLPQSPPLVAAPAAGESGCRRRVDVVLAFRHRNPEDFRFWAALAAQGFDAHKEDLVRMGLAEAVLGGGAAQDVHVFRLDRARQGGTPTEVAAAAAEALKPHVEFSKQALKPM